MIIDDIQSREIDGDVERSATVRWRGGEHRLTIQVPAEFAASADDASPFVAASLMSAMRRQEDLDVDGAVSARLLRRLHDIQATYMMWDPTLVPCHVRATGTLDAPQGAAGIGAFFTCGVDSIYTAIGAGEPEWEPIERLIFSPSLDGSFDAEVGRQALAQTRESAAQLGLPVIRVETNIRAMTDLAVNWDDVCGSALAFLALSLAGGLDRVVIPSTHFHGNLKPHGSHPLLDPLYSTESVQILHDAITQSRFAKVAYIVANAPEMLPHLKVCYAESRPDNCGQCPKCLRTMSYLEACGALKLARSFPAELDLDLLGNTAQAPPWRMDMVECCRALDPVADGALREAIIETLRTSVRPTPRARAAAAFAALRGEREHPDPRWANSVGAAARNTINRQLAILWEGRPYPPLERRIDPLSVGGSVSVGPIGASAPKPRNADLVGLVRVLDRPAGRHVYGASEIPPPQRPPRAHERDLRALVGELGSLHTHGGEDRVPLWLTEDGRVATSQISPGRRRPGPLRVARWVVAPAAWSRGTSPRALGVAMLRRLAALPAAYQAPRGRIPCTGDPVGYLDSAPGRGRVPLYSAIHLVTGDQLLTNDPREAGDLGYAAPALLGHLVGEAPVTGTLGTTRPRIEWASRFGLRTK